MRPQRRSEHLVYLSLMLVGLLLGITLVIGLFVRIEPIFVLPTVLLVFAGVAILATSTEVVLVSLGLVLATLNADLPLYASHSGEVAVWIFDAPILAAVLLLAYRAGPVRLGWPRYVAGGLLAIAIWSLVVALLGAPLSPVSAVAFALDQWRYVLFFVFGALAVHRFDLDHLLSVICLTVAAHVFIALLQIYRNASFGLSTMGDLPKRYGLAPIDVGPLVLGTGIYPGGLMGSSRVLLGATILLIPVAYVYLWRDPVWRRVAAATVLFGAVALTAVSFSNTAQVVIPMVTILFLVSLTYTYNNDRFAIPTKVIVSGGLLSLAVALLMLGYLISYGRIGFNNVVVRGEMYMAAIRVLHRNPFLGVGGYNFELLSLELGGKTSMPVHSTPLAYFVELGFLGGFLFLTTLLTVYVAGTREVLNRRGPDEILVALFTGLAGFQAYSLVTLMYNRPWLISVFWISAGVLIGWSDQSNGESAEVQRAPAANR